MPLAQNFSLNAFLGAAVLGVIGAAGMYLVESYKQEKLRYQMSKDLARLDQELSQVKRELSELLEQKTQQSASRPRRNRSVRKANSIISNSTDDYLSACNVDSSDLEFYDVSDEENEKSLNLEHIMDEIDSSLDHGSLDGIKTTLATLTDLCEKHPDNFELLWRLGKAHHKISEHLDEAEKTIIQNHIGQGIDACAKALELKEDSYDSHKWYAILIGSRSDFVGLQQKIADGHLFKKHVDRAIELNPNDSSLHHMLGRFDYEVAGLKWYERKAAAALFSEPPNATYDQALGHFLEAEKLADFEWKTNMLMIAKCQIALGNIKEAVEWLIKADQCNGGLDKIDTEIKTLLKKYNISR